MFLVGEGDSVITQVLNKSLAEQRQHEEANKTKDQGKKGPNKKLEKEQTGMWCKLFAEIALKKWLWYIISLIPYLRFHKALRKTEAKVKDFCLNRIIKLKLAVAVFSHTIVVKKANFPCPHRPAPAVLSTRSFLFYLLWFLYEANSRYAVSTTNMLGCICDGFLNRTIVSFMISSPNSMLCLRSWIFLFVREWWCRSP